MHVAHAEGGLRAALRRLWAVYRSPERVLIGDGGPDVGRVFVVCHSCGHLRRMWRLADKTELVCGQCGSSQMIPRRLSLVRAFYYVVIEGLLWRRLILRKRTQRLWDPRMSVRFREPAY
jgi:hypothetical protein